VEARIDLEESKDYVSIHHIYLISNPNAGGRKSRRFVAAYGSDTSVLRFLDKKCYIRVFDITIHKPLIIKTLREKILCNNYKSELMIDI
jgi:hypothetical protein